MLFCIPMPGFARSIDRHPTGDRSVAQVWHLRHVCFFIVALNLASRDVWLEPFPEIERAHYGIGDGHYDQDDSDDGEGR